MNNPRKISTLLLATCAVVAAAYAALTIALAPISYGAVQFRVSEALTILPFFIPGTVWGLTADRLPPSWPACSRRASAGRETRSETGSSPA